MSFLDKILGPRLATWEEGQQKIGVLSGVPTLGLDALSSSAYGPEAAMTILLPVGAVGLGAIGPITGVILGLLIILYLSYRQTIGAYPGGGGAYTVAKENLGVTAGLLAGASLMVDYVLTVAVGISAGVGALVSAFPQLQSSTLPICLGILVLITLINLRGARESGVAFAVPTYLFVLCLGAVLVLGLVRAAAAGGHPTPLAPPPALPEATRASVGVWLWLRAFASGCTAMTGVEAVSNGVGAFAQPAVRNAQRTLTVIVVILVALLAGIVLLCQLYGVGATDPTKPGYQSVLSALTAAIVGRGPFYYVTLATILLVLTLSANTSFAGFPRLCRLLAQDDFLPHAFAQIGRRLVYTAGIVVLALTAGVLLAVFGGITDRLIPLYAVGAFGAFTLSQAGMVVHWRRTGRGLGARLALAVNGLGAIATAAALVVILVAKFVEGAWITLLLIPGCVWLFRWVSRHYAHAERQVACTHPLELNQLEEPLVVVPIEDWNLLTEAALRFGMRVSSLVVAVHVDLAEEGAPQPSPADRLRKLWPAEVEGPAQRAGRPVPRLEVVASPYRRIFRPVREVIDRLRTEQPGRMVAVIIPELVQTRWYEWLLHNHRAEGLKASLLLHGDQRIVVVNVPWYLQDGRVRSVQVAAPQ